MGRQYLSVLLSHKINNDEGFISVMYLFKLSNESNSIFVCRLEVCIIFFIKMVNRLNTFTKV